MREANEELGIDADDVRVIGATDEYRTGTGYQITPVLAVVPEGLALHPSPNEVASWFEPPLAFMLDTANHTRHTGEWDGRKGSYIEIMWGEHRVWGVTAGIIANLAQRVAYSG